ncbi:MAG: cytochrome c [Pseudomonadota bacterium]
MKSIAFFAALALGALVSVVHAGGDAAAGKSKSTTCAACHGVDGNSPIPVNPKLAGQHADYLVQALKDYKTGARKNPVMSGMVAPLSDQDILDLAAYFAAQEGLSTAKP